MFDPSIDSFLAQKIAVLSFKVNASLSNRMMSFQIKIDMPDILSIDEEQKFVRVEPMVSIGHLNDFLVKRGW